MVLNMVGVRRKKNRVYDMLAHQQSKVVTTG